jgi:hypothetical protein
VGIPVVVGIAGTLEVGIPVVVGIAGTLEVGDRVEVVDVSIGIMPLVVSGSSLAQARAREPKPIRTEEGHRVIERNIV